MRPNLKLDSGIKKEVTPSLISIYVVGADLRGSRGQQ